MASAPRLTRFAGESWRTAGAMHARVVGAVIMRDLQTRFGVGYLGFLLGLIMPLGHLTIVVTITIMLRRPIPLGTDAAIFSMTGVLPFIIWLYSHRQVMGTLALNRPLTYFPGVDISDLFFAKAIIEVVAATLVVATVLPVLSMLGYNLNINNIYGFSYGLVLAWVLGIVTGMTFGLLGSIAPVFFIFGNLLAPLFWVSSGLLFLPDALPEKLSAIVYFNPLAHVVDFVRESYYSEYISLFFDPRYLMFFLVSILLFAMILMFIIRRVT